MIERTPGIASAFGCHEKIEDAVAARKNGELEYWKENRRMCEKHLKADSARDKR